MTMIFNSMFVVWVLYCVQLFPECVAKSSAYSLGVWGLDPCSPRVSRRVVVGSVSRRRRVVNSVSMGEAAIPLLFEGFQAGCHVVLRGRRGAL